MRIGNIKICKNVVKGFCVGTGVGVVIGAIPAYLLARHWFLGHIYYMTEDELEEIGYFDDPVEEVNPLQESDDRKAKIVSDLIMSGEGYQDKTDDGISNKINRLGYKVSEENLKRISENSDLMDRIENMMLYGWEDPDLEGVTPEDYEEDDVNDGQEEILINVFDTVDKDEEEAQRISEELHGGEPYTISREQFVESCTDFTKTTIGYYTENDILVDDIGEIIDDREDWIGKHGLEKFGVESDDEDTVYLRNPFKQIDYEVVRYHEAFE